MKHYYKIITGALVILVAFFVVTLASWYFLIRSHEVLGTASKVTRGVVYTTSHNSDLNKLDIYRPADSLTHPVVIFIHGGGWRTGTRLLDGAKHDFFVKNGFVYVTIDYRLSPDIMHPEHVEDVADAISWVSKNISKYGGNSNQIFLVGHSAGAHLAALVSTDESYLQERGLKLSALKGTILLDGAGYDIPYLREVNPAYFKGLYEVPFGTDNEVLKKASPINAVAAGKAIPPFLFLYTTRPMAVLENALMVKKFKDTGLSYQEVKYSNEDHMTIVENFGKDNHEPTRKTLEFINLYRGR